MLLYTPSIEHDYLLEAWYHVLVESKELPLLFTNAAHQRLGYFLRYLDTPRQLVFDTTGEGAIIRAAWFDPFDVGTRACLWIHPDHRQESASLVFVVRALEAALTAHGTVFGITIQPHLIEPHLHLGYTILTHRPSGCDGHDAWILMLTKEGLQRSPVYGKVRRQLDRAAAERDEPRPV